MRKSVRIGIVFALIWIILKLIAYNFKIYLNEIKPFVFLNMLLITIAISVTLYSKFKYLEEEPNTLDNIKSAMITGLIYTFLVSGFIYIYYEHIYPEFTSSRIREIELRLEDEDYLKQQKEDLKDTEMEVATDQEVKSKILNKAMGVYSTKRTTIVGLSGLLIYSLFNSVLIALIFKKFFFRNYPTNSRPKES